MGRESMHHLPSRKTLPHIHRHTINQVTASWRNVCPHISRPIPRQIQVELGCPRRVGNFIPREGNLHGVSLRAGSGGGEGHGTRQPLGSGTADGGLFVFHKTLGAGDDTRDSQGPGKLFSTILSCNHDTSACPRARCRAGSITRRMASSLPGTPRKAASCGSSDSGAWTSAA